MTDAYRLARLLLIVSVLAACTATPTADFAFALEDSSLAVAPGASVATSAIVTPLNGFAGSVALALTDRDGAPVSGVSVAPASIVVSASELAAQSVQRTIAIDVSATVANDVYQLRLTATSGARTSDADLTLTVADNLLPRVVIASPSDGAVVTGSRRVELTGTLDSLNTIVALDVVGGADLIALDFDQAGFRATLELEDNRNGVIVVATDSAGGVGASTTIELSYPFLDLTTFQAASVVIGQPDFVSGAPNQGGAVGANTVSPSNGGNPYVADSGALFLPDSGNDRVLGFDAVPGAADASADFVLGQPDFATDVQLDPPTASSFYGPGTVTSDGTRLAVVDIDNSRILIWNAIPDSTQDVVVGQAGADVVVGQAGFVTNTTGCSSTTLDVPQGGILAAGRLIVADSANHRVLIWNSVPTTNGQPADLVLGQASFTTCAPNDADQDGASDGGPSARTFSSPRGVWSDGERLVVADRSNHRVLIWESFPTSDFVPADVVVGQPDFSSGTGGVGPATFENPAQVTSNGNQLFVADAFNRRVLIYHGFPVANGAAADVVLGQSDFVHDTGNDDDQDGVDDGAPTARTLGGALGVFAHGDRLIVADSGNARYLIYEVP